MNEALRKLEESILILIAKYLPRRVIYWCIVRAVSEAGYRYPTTELPAITATELLETWAYD